MNPSQLCVFIGGPHDGAHAWYSFDEGYFADPAGFAVIWRVGRHWYHQYIAATPIGQQVEVLRLVHRKVAARSALASATD